jgi:hypothetical protein
MEQMLAFFTSAAWFLLVLGAAALTAGVSLLFWDHRTLGGTQPTTKLILRMAGTCFVLVGMTFLLHKIYDMPVDDRATDPASIDTAGSPRTGGIKAKPGVPSSTPTPASTAGGRSGGLRSQPVE